MNNFEQIRELNKVANEIRKMNFNANEITLEEGWLLTFDALRYHSKRYYGLVLKVGFEELLDKAYETFLRRGLFEKYAVQEGGGKKGYVSSSVYKFLIDVIRVYKETDSLDKEIEGKDGSETTMHGILVDTKATTDNDIVLKNDVKKLIDNLDEGAGKAEGVSPLLGFSKLNKKTVALHILHGYKVSEIASFYKNPETGKEVASTYVTKLLRKMKSDFECLR